MNILFICIFLVRSKSPEMSKKPTQAWGSSTMGVYYIILIHMCNYVTAQVSVSSQCRNTGLLQFKVKITKMMQICENITQ